MGLASTINVLSNEDTQELAPGFFIKTTDSDYSIQEKTGEPLVREFTEDTG
jgi:hypothetical protein